MIQDSILVFQRPGSQPSYFRCFGDWKSILTADTTSLRSCAQRFDAKSAEILRELLQRTYRERIAIETADDGPNALSEII